MTINNGTQTVLNTNGHHYEVISKKGQYTLLKRLAVAPVEYVVAWNMQEVEGGMVCWGQGHYFWDIEQAVSFISRK